MVEQQTGLELGVLIMGKTRVRSEQGVSLIETLVALLILSFVSISTLAMFSQGMRLNAAGVDYSLITNLAKDKAEELLSLGYDAPDLAPDVERSETLYDERIEITWRVAEHQFMQGLNNPTDVFKGANMTSDAAVMAAGTGNVKVISVTVSSTADYAIGRRTVTVQGMMVKNT